MPHILTVEQFNKQQEEQYKEYCNECKANNVPFEPFNRYFTKFDYKRGYVATGRYPIYAKRKKDLIY